MDETRYGGGTEPFEGGPLHRGDEEGCACVLVRRRPAEAGERGGRSESDDMGRVFQGCPERRNCREVGEQAEPFGRRRSDLLLGVAGQELAEDARSGGRIAPADGTGRSLADSRVGIAEALVKERKGLLAHRRDRLPVPRGSVEGEGLARARGRPAGPRECPGGAEPHPDRGIAKTSDEGREGGRTDTGEREFGPIPDLPVRRAKRMEQRRQGPCASLRQEGDQVLGGRVSGAEGPDQPRGVEPGDAGEHPCSPPAKVRASRRNELDEGLRISRGEPVECRRRPVADTGVAVLEQAEQPWDIVVGSELPDVWSEAIWEPDDAPPRVVTDIGANRFMSIGRGP